MFLPKFLVAGIAGIGMLAFTAPDAKAQYVQYTYGNGYVQPYGGNVYRGNSYYTPNRVYQSGYYNNSYYNRGYGNRGYYNQPYYGGRNYYNNGYGNRGSGLFFNFGIRR